jgi:hypothetical protein
VEVLVEEIVRRLLSDVKGQMDWGGIWIGHFLTLCLVCTGAPLPKAHGKVQTPAGNAGMEEVQSIMGFQSTPTLPLESMTRLRG